MMNLENLKNYIENVYKLEASLYEQNKLYWKINENIKWLENIQYEPEIAYEENSYGMGIGCLSVFGGSILGMFVGIGLQIHNYLLLILIVFGAICTNFFIYIYCKKEFNTKNREIKEKNEQIEKENHARREINEQNIVQLQKFKKIIGTTYDDTKGLLKEYYALNIIFPKYRNFIAVSSFYEYLSSGRCSRLEGYDGAYNIYENEIRLNLIINKLDRIIALLEEIKENQYMIYSAIKESNKITSKIAEELHNASYYLKDIRNNTSITTYNTSVIAQNTEFQKWLEIMRDA